MSANVLSPTPHLGSHREEVWVECHGGEKVSRAGIVNVGGNAETEREAQLSPFGSLCFAGAGAGV